MAAEPDSWPGWRGPHRDGIARWLPERLPGKARIVWRRHLSGPAMAGLSAAGGQLLVADRDAGDRFDMFRALDAQTGAERWVVRMLAGGELDFGNASRATPLFDAGRVYLLNAFGNLQCVAADTGQLIWKKDLYREFQVRDKPDWGTCSSPLVVDGKLIVNPGGREAALVALNPATGELVWKTPGRKAAYGSFIAVPRADRTELVGYDATSLGGWDAATGRRLWSVVPPQPHDFNVPTPLLAPAAGPGEKLLVVSTENNGTRAYRFSSDGTLAPRPVAECPELAPDSQTPVVLDVRASRDDRPRPRLFGVWQGLHCLDLRADHLLRPIWTAADPAFDNYAVVIGCGNRILVVANTGELLLVDAAADAYRLISRFKVFEDDEGVYGHPALVGTRLYLRGSDEVVCLELGS